MTTMWLVGLGRRRRSCNANGATLVWVAITPTTGPLTCKVKSGMQFRCQNWHSDHSCLVRTGDARTSRLILKFSRCRKTSNSVDQAATSANVTDVSGAAQCQRCKVTEHAGRLSYCHGLPPTLPPPYPEGGWSGSTNPSWFSSVWRGAAISAPLRSNDETIGTVSLAEGTLSSAMTEESLRSGYSAGCLLGRVSTTWHAPERSTRNHADLGHVLANFQVLLSATTLILANAGTFSSAPAGRNCQISGMSKVMFTT